MVRDLAVVTGSDDTDAALVVRKVFEVELSAMTAAVVDDSVCDDESSPLTTTTVLTSTANTPNTLMPAALTTTTSNTSLRSHCKKDLQLIYVCTTQTLTDRHA